MEACLLMNDGLNQANATLEKLCQAFDKHQELYPRVEEASATAWEIWHSRNEWKEMGMQLQAQIRTAFATCQRMHLAFNNYVQKQLQPLTLGPGQFGHPGKPSPKPAKQSVNDLSEAYMLANRAIYNHRTKFFKLDPQEKRCKLITAASFNGIQTVHLK